MQRRSFLRQGAMLGLGGALGRLAAAETVQPAAAGSGQPAPAGGLRTLRSLDEFQQADGCFARTIVKALDLAHLDLDFWRRAETRSAYFIGCRFANAEVENWVRANSAMLLPRLDGRAYDPFQPTLYTPADIVRETPAGKIRDVLIYEDYVARGKFSPDPLEALARSLHDYSMDDGLEQLVREVPQTEMVCITGGFFQPRTDPWFRKTAELARLLARAGRFIVTGGGPGIMEAANLGAYLADNDDSALETALEILAEAPEWTDAAWHDRALEVLAEYPDGRRNLGIPTWFYGFEPTNLFATDIAKYFDNDIREGILMSIAKGGAVFSPGSAGARQEIFMVATQNHFGGGGYFYPMVLFGTHHYQVETEVFQLLRQVANDNYRHLVYSTDDAADVVRFIRDNPPRRSEQAQ